MKILLIDDDPILHFYIETALLSIDKNISLTKCLDCTEGLAELSKISSQNGTGFDIMLVDLNLPDMMGWDFLERYSENGYPTIFNKTKIYIISSSIDEMDIQRANNNPLIEHYVRKPIDRKVLQAILDGESIPQ